MFDEMAGPDRRVSRPNKAVRSLKRAVADAARACLVETLESRRLLAGEGLSAVYYNNSNLTAIALKRVDPTVSFDWAMGSPDASIEADSFSVRWSGLIKPQFNENYTFYAVADDGVRVWVNDQLVIDEWHAATPNEYSGNIELNAGQNYAIRVEYFDEAGAAAIHLAWSSDSQSKTIIPQSALSADSAAPGAPVLSLDGKTDTLVELSWSKPGDDVGIMGYNVYRDGVKVAFTTNRWYVDTGLLPASGYSYTVKALDYVNTLSANSNTVAATTNAAGANGINAIYYGTANLAGIKVKRIDSNIEFDWASGSPDAAVPVDGFSVRWSGKIQARYTERYTFHTMTDDGVRLWVNNQLLIDNWSSGAADNSGQINLVAGQKYTIKMEYYDGSGAAAAYLLWSSPSQAQRVVPASALFADQSAPTTPTGLYAAAVTSSSISLAWNAASDDVLVQGYNVFRDGVKIAQVAGTTYADTGLPSESTRAYQVQALDGYNNLSSLGGSLAATTAVNLNGLTAVYYDNDDLSHVKVKRTDATVNFAWGAGSPDASVGPDTFSARWTGKVLANFTGTHTFRTQSDDGTRLWINGQLLIDNWGPHGLADNAGTIALTAGQKYAIRLEYRDVSGDATMRLMWTQPGVAEQVVPVENLFIDQTAPTTPTGLAASKTNKSVALAWNAASDDVGVLFYNIFRDGVKIAQIPASGTTYTDSGLPITTTYSYQVQAVDGYHRLSSLGSAVAVTTDAAPGNGLSAVYFNNQDFTFATVKRVDEAVDFDWGAGSPDPSMDPDSFSVYWSGFVQPQFSQTYTFYTTSDEGVRLYVNNQLVIDNYSPHGVTENSGTIALTAGQKYKLRMEYYEGSLDARISLAWSSANVVKQIIPLANLFPDTAAPSIPTNLRVTAKTDSEIALAWNGSTDNVSIRIYNVYRNGAKIASTTGTTWNDTGLAADTTYTYTVAASDYALILSAASSPLAVTTNSPGSPIVTDAFSPIVGGSFDGNSGASKNGNYATGLDFGDWIKFSNVDFGSTGAQSLRMRIGTPLGNAGGRIDIRLDSPSGPTIGSLVVQTTGGYGTFVEQVAATSWTTGRHDLYLYVAGGWGIGQIDTFRFSTAPLVKIMPLGDSITQAPGGEASYRYWLWKSLNNAGYSVNFVGSGLSGYDGQPAFYDFDQNHEGHAGYTSVDVLNNIGAWVGANVPNVVLLHIGTNDVRNGIGTSTTINNISAIIDSLRSYNPNVTVLLAQIIPTTGYDVQPLNGQIAGLAGWKNTGQSRVILVDQYSGFDIGADTMDGIHPDASGEQKLSARWYTSLTSGVL